jgi:hypothetical protein
VEVKLHQLKLEAPHSEVVCPTAECLSIYSHKFLSNIGLLNFSVLLGDVLQASDGLWNMDISASTPESFQFGNSSCAKIKASYMWYFEILDIQSTHLRIANTTNLKFSSLKFQTHPSAKT